MTTQPPPSASLIEPGLVALDVDLGSTKQEVIRGLAAVVAATGRADADGLATDALHREGKAPTGMPGGFAIPHCRSAAVNTASLGFARLSTPVDFGAKDGPADVVFLIAASENGGADHLRLLTKLARALVKPEFLAALRAAGDRDEVVRLVREVVEPDTATPAAPAPGGATTVTMPTPATGAPGADAGNEPMSIIAITACPTGIAHTYMAADYLTNAGKEMGITVVTEPQGSTATDPVTPEQIAAASAVIFATDVGVKGRGRFAGKPVIESGVRRAVDEPRVMIEEAIAAAHDPRARRVPASGEDAGASSPGTKGGLGWGKRIQQALMTGVSYMIPFVAAGGLLIALGFLLAGYQIPFVGDFVLGKFSLTHLPTYADLVSAKAPDGSAMFTSMQLDHLHHSGLLLFLGAAMWKLGGLAFGFLVPALAGYIAFALADRPGIAPGFVAGAVASWMTAGFLGGLVGGLIAGLVAAWIAGWRVPRWLRGLMPVVIIPLLASLITGGLLLFVLGHPIAWVMTEMNKGLSHMTGSSAVLLGIVLGLMMCFDLGGPVNKTAYLFATTNLVVAADPTPSMKIMAAVMAAGMVPPLALALSTAVRPRLYSAQERENGLASWLLGASFISEGAIPFAAADPASVIPSMMVGGAVTGAMSMAFGAASKAPHGGLFVAFAISGLGWWLLSIVAGTVVAALLVTTLKSVRARRRHVEVTPA